MGWESEDDSDEEEFFRRRADANEIKVEPEEIHDPVYSMQEEQISIINYEPPSQIQVKEEPLDDPPLQDSIQPSPSTQKRQASASSAGKSNGLSKEMRDYTHLKAKDIQEREKKKPNDAFHAHVPRNLKTVAPQSTVSALTVSAFNSQYSFQATSDNVKQVAVDSNPYSHLPWSVQKTAAHIGANMDRFQAPDNRPPRVSSPLASPGSSPASGIPQKMEFNVRSQVQPQRSTAPPKDLKNKETQTMSTNDGVLRFELTDDKLRDLTKDQKRALLEFKKQFKLEDHRSFEAMEERALLRESSRFYPRDRRREEPIDERRNDHREYRRERKESPPAKRYYNPPP